MDGIDQTIYNPKIDFKEARVGKQLKGQQLDHFQFSVSKINRNLVVG